MRKPSGPRRVARASRPTRSVRRHYILYRLYHRHPRIHRRCSFGVVPVDAGGGTASNSTAAAKAAGTVLRAQLSPIDSHSHSRYLRPAFSLSLSFSLPLSCAHLLPPSLPPSIRRHYPVFVVIVVVVIVVVVPLSARLPRYCTACAIGIPNRVRSMKLHISIITVQSY